MDWPGLDHYTVRARLFPALLCILPIPVLMVAVLPALIDIWQSIIGSLLAASGGAFLLAEFGRDLGKKLEPELFDKWGGKPTTRFLSYSGPRSREAVSRVHRRLEGLFPGLNLPTAEEERGSPAKAREIYDEAVTRLRTLTRDAEDHPLVFKENVSYGFRRNLLGLKPIGLSLAVLGLVVSVVLALGPMIRSGQSDVARYVLALAVCGALVLAWWLRVRPDWVRIPAEAYAERLIESVTKLEREGAGGS